MPDWRAFVVHLYIGRWCVTFWYCSTQLDKTCACTSARAGVCLFIRMCGCTREPLPLPPLPRFCPGTAAFACAAMAHDNAERHTESYAQFHHASRSWHRWIITRMSSFMSLASLAKTIRQLYYHRAGSFAKPRKCARTNVINPTVANHACARLMGNAGFINF